MSKHAIDSCSLINIAHNYNMAKSTFQPIWKKIEAMIDSGKLITTIITKDEIEDEDLVKWIKLRKKLFIPLSKDIQDEVKKILNDHPSLIKISRAKILMLIPF
jgi:predicted DNA-binding protein YlxM (UPF0122 family)